MRNLKKVLSLVLALAMVLSICMVGAGAVNYDDFTDEGEITKKQAVETLVSLDVIKGYNDGATFNPTGNVTRAEMATMICRILAGGDNMIVDATKPVPTYADIDGHWAESYIEYCTSLGIVSGKSPSSFDPNADVTAAEAAKMVMTTLGYNADIEGFKGIGWDINTMAKANTLLLLNNLQGEISSSVPATREQVAQLLFNALGAYTVQNYVGTTANTWIGSGAEAYHETLLESKFNAQKIVGVVVANEWADLYGEDPLAAGRTRVRALGTDNMPTKQEYTVNLSTSLEQVGESIIVYRDTTSNRILFGNDQSTDLNVVNEYTAKGNITDSKDFENAISKDSLTKDTEYFVNYDIGYSTTSDYRIGYTVTLSELDEAAKVKGFEDLAGLSTQIKDNGGKDKPNGGTLATDKYDKIIRPGDEITSLDLSIIKAIFDAAGLTGTAEAGDKDIDVGEVYVGTQSNKDISDETSYSKFQDTYLDSNLAKDKIIQNYNGDYIKTVDYNNDGEIDYVLQTIYNTTNVERVKDNGDITLYLDNVPSSDINAKSKIDSYAPYDDLATDDIVVYAVIDGIAHVYLCDTVTAKIDKVNRNKLTCTTTDGEEYTQSDVIEYIDDDLVFDHGVTNLAGSVSYNLYFDRYGYLTAFTEATSGTYTLLINGWFNYARGGREYAVKAYIDGETVDRDVKKNGDLFIYDDDDNAGKNNSWELIKQLGGTNKLTTALNADGVYPTINDVSKNCLTTTIASLSEDGILTPVDLIYNNQNKRDVKMIATKDDKIPMRDYVTGTAYTTDTRTKAPNNNAYNVVDSEVEVRGLNSTVYYCVYPGQGNNDPIVRAYNGYNSLRLTKDDEKLIEDVYVVGSRVNRDSDLEYSHVYYTAEAVVIEFSAQTQGRAREVFVVDMPVVGGGVQLDEIQIIDEDGTEKTVTVDLTKSDYRTVGQVLGSGDASTYGIAGDKTVMPGLYYLYETNEKDVYTIKTMDHEDIDTARYAVGRVNTSRGTASDLFAGVVRYTFTDNDKYDDAVYLDKDGKQVEVNKDITDTTGLYNLSYSGSNSGIKANLDKKDSWRDVLYEYVDRVERGTLDREFQLPDRGTTKYDANYNDVLIRYSGNNIVYAVSFANMANGNRDYTGADTTPSNRNFAQIVWDNVKPVDKEKAGVTLNFYGEPVTADANRKFVGEVSWLTASKFVPNDKNEAVVVKDGKVIIGDSKVNVKDTEVVFEGTIEGDDGKYYTYELTQNAKIVTDGDLRSTDRTIVTVEDQDKAAKTVTLWVSDQDTTSLKTLAAYLTTTQTGDKVEVIGKDIDGVVLNEQEVIKNCKTLQIKVTTTDGVSKEYNVTIVGSSTFVTLTLVNGVVPYTDATFTTAIPTTTKNDVTTAVVKKATNVYLMASGRGTITSVAGGSLSTAYNAEKNVSTTYIAVGADDTLTFTAVPAVSGKVNTIKLPLARVNDGAYISGTIADGDLLITVPVRPATDIWQTGSTTLFAEDAALNYWFGSGVDTNGFVTENAYLDADGEFTVEAVEPDAGCFGALKFTAAGINSETSQTVTVNFKADATQKSYEIYFTVSKSTTGNFNFALKDLSNNTFLTASQILALGITADDITITKTPIRVSNDGGVDYKIVWWGTPVSGNPDKTKPQGGVVPIDDGAVTSGLTDQGTGYATAGTLQAQGFDIFEKEDRAVYSAAGLVLQDANLQSHTPYTSTVELKVEIEGLNITAMHGVCHIDHT